MTTQLQPKSTLNLGVVGTWESGDYWKLTKDGNGNVVKVQNDGSNDVTFVDENGKQIGNKVAFTGGSRTAFLAQEIGGGMTPEQVNAMLKNAGYSYNSATGNFDGNATAKQAFDLTGTKVLATMSTATASTDFWSGVGKVLRSAWNSTRSLAASFWSDTFASNPKKPEAIVPGQSAYDPTKSMSLSNPPREDYLGIQLGAPSAEDAWQYCAVDAYVLAGLNYGGPIQVDKTATLMTALSKSGAFGLNGTVPSPEAAATIIKITAALNGKAINPSVGPLMRYSEYLKSNQYDSAVLAFSTTGSVFDLPNNGHYEFQRKQSFLVGSKQVDPAAGDYGNNYIFTGYVRPIKKNG